MKLQTLLLLLLLAVAVFALWWHGFREPPWKKYYDRGLAYTQSGEYEEAYTEFLKAVSEAGEDGRSSAIDHMADSYMLAAGLVDLRLGRPQRALELYRKFAELYPAHPRAVDAWLLIARLYTDKLNQPNEAILVYKALWNEHRDDPRLKELPVQVVRLYIHLHDFQQAVVEAREFLQQEPAREDAPRLKFLVGDALAFEERHEEALRAYQTVMREYPESAEAKLAPLEMGNCLLKLGRNAEALEQFELALANYPNPDVVKLRIHKAQLQLKRDGDTGNLPWDGESLQGAAEGKGPDLIDPFPEDRKGGSGRVAPPSPDGDTVERSDIPLEDLDPPEFDSLQPVSGP